LQTPLLNLLIAYGIDLLLLPHCQFTQWFGQAAGIFFRRAKIGVSVRKKG